MAGRFGSSLLLLAVCVLSALAHAQRPGSGSKTRGQSDIIRLASNLVAGMKDIGASVR